MGKVLRVEDLRPIMQGMYPEVENDRGDNAPFEHPMTAVGLVLLSAAILGTSKLSKLAVFTGYSRSFISAITLNMQNNRLWIDSRYDTSTWLLSDGSIAASCFWEHIEVACGVLWTPAGDTHIAADTCKVYWDRTQALARRSSQPKEIRESLNFGSHSLTRRITDEYSSRRYVFVFPIHRVGIRS